jgi:cytochrome P450
MGGATWVFTTDPELIEGVFAADPAVLQHEVLLSPLVGTHSLLTLDEPDHLAVRRQLQPPFHRERVQRHRDLMARICEQEVAGWPLDEPLPLLPRLQTIALNVILSVIFGVTDDAREKSLRTQFAELLEWGASPLRVVWHQQKTLRGWKSPRSFVRLLEPVDAMIFEEIERARRDPRLDERDDVLAMLVQAHREDGGAMTDREIRDHLMTLTFLGHRSTAVALAWALERLTRHPEIVERVRDEALGASEEYLDAVVTETLRVRSPFPFVLRAVKQPYPLGEYELPAGTLIALNTYMLHRREDLYPEPDTFSPERFLEQPPGPYTWIPFGGGMRACIGASFALSEMKVVLRTILQQFQLAPAEERDEEIRRLGVQFSPGSGARVVLRERDAAAGAG